MGDGGWSLNHRLLPVLWGVAAAMSVACGDDPGTLTLKLDSFDAATRATTITLSGSVTRTPSRETPIVVRTTGLATGAPFDTALGGRFTLQLNLAQNTNNQFSVTASDGTGATSEIVAVSIRHDNKGPAISQSTPQNAADGVDPAIPTVEVKLSERPVIAAGGGIRLLRQGVPVAGTRTVSSDSLTLTFSPSAPFAANVVYQIAFPGVADSLGNPAGTGCFVTAVSGVAPSNIFGDFENDWYYALAEPEPGFVIPDLLAARFSRDEALFTTVLQFRTPGVFARTAEYRGGVWLDLDVDQDSTTGAVTFKDTLFTRDNPPDGIESSGSRAEYFVDVEPVAELGDSAALAMYTSDASGDVVGLFVPDACGAFVGFGIPLADLGGETGDMNIVMLGLAEADSSETPISFVVDPMPAGGHLTTTLALATPSSQAAPTGYTRASVPRRTRARPQFHTR